MHYPTAKEPIGEGHVFWSDEGRQIRVFGETTTLRGPTAVLERVAMRVLHLVDGHGPCGAEADTACKRCEAVREARRKAKYFSVIWQCPRTEELGMVRFQAKSLAEAQAQARRCLPPNVVEVFIIHGGDSPERFLLERG